MSGLGEGALLLEEEVEWLHPAREMRPIATDRETILAAAILGSLWGVLSVRRTSSPTDVGSLTTDD
jgi:hypothetical protein